MSSCIFGIDDKENKYYLVSIVYVGICNNIVVTLRIYIQPVVVVIVIV